MTCRSSSSAIAGNDKDPPLALFEHVTHEVVLVKPLHDDNDDSVFFVVEPTQQGIVIPVVNCTSPSL